MDNLNDKAKVFVDFVSSSSNGVGVKFNTIIFAPALIATSGSVFAGDT